MGLKLCPLAAALFLTACSASNCDVEVYLSSDIKDAYGEVPSLEVDVAGVTAVQQQRLLTADADAYFTPGSALRRSLNPVTLHFAPGNEAPYVIENGSRWWEQWEERGASYLAVLCNLPALTSAGSGGALAQADGRVLLIDMHDGFIKDSAEHLVLISAGGVIEIEEAPRGSGQLRRPEEPEVR